MQTTNRNHDANDATNIFIVVGLLKGFSLFLESRQLMRSSDSRVSKYQCDWEKWIFGAPVFFSRWISKLTPVFHIHNHPFVKSIKTVSKSSGGLHPMWDWCNVRHQSSSNCMDEFQTSMPPSRLELRKKIEILNSFSGCLCESLRKSLEDLNLLLQWTSTEYLWFSESDRALITAITCDVSSFMSPGILLGNMLFC